MKEKIAIVTDSTCDIPTEVIEEYGIHVLPLRIVYERGEFRDNVEISAEEVYDSLAQEVPSTSLPSPEDILTLFEQLKSDGFTHVLAIHLSSGLSGTSQLVRTLAAQVKGMVVEVVDSRSISMGLGCAVLEAAKKLQENASFEGIKSHVERTLANIKVFFVLSTLEYLKKGGRIGKVAGTLGQILNMKPIITVNPEGVYETLAKVRGRKQSLEKLFEIAHDHVRRPFRMAAVCHGAAKEEAQQMAERLKGLVHIKDIFVSHVSPVIGVHTGPGTLGFVVLQED